LARLSSQTGISNSTVIIGDPYAFYSGNATGSNYMSVVATTYVWHLTHYIDGNSDVDIWWPNTPDNIEIGYSLHLYNPDATGIIGISDITNCKIYPNPANDVLYASIVLSKTENVAISITDITGRVLEIKNLSAYDHYLTFFNTDNLAAGIYFCTIKTASIQQVKKFTKQ